jgi:hypothetical protein
MYLHDIVQAGEAIQRTMADRTVEEFTLDEDLRALTPESPAAGPIT